MAYRVRACRTPEELAEALKPIGHYFGWVPDVEDGERFARILPPERSTRLSTTARQWPAPVPSTSS